MLSIVSVGDGEMDKTCVNQVKSAMCPFRGFGIWNIQVNNRIKKVWGKYWAALPKMGIDMLFLFVNGKKLNKKGH